jgi:phosphoesterase RecJ-like protein
MFTEIQQLHKLINDSKHILFVFSNQNDVDSISSALAFSNFLEKQGKKTDIVCDNFISPKNAQFLDGIDTIKQELSFLQKFTIKVDVSKAKLETISYDVKDNLLSIHLTPKHGQINKEDLRTSTSSYKYDLIISIGAPDLESLKNIFLANTDLFYKTQVVNIDHKTENEHFGQINFVDINATSNCAIIYKIIKNLGEAYIDSNIATCVLTGIIFATNSFKTANVTPQILNIASQLIEHGADREKIVKNLYRTKTINSLRLWGAALAGLKHDLTKKFAWTILTRDVFLQTQANENELQGIATELLNSSSEIDAALILYEQEIETKIKINGIIYAKRGNDARLLVAPYDPVGGKTIATFKTDLPSLKQAEEEITNYIKKILQ